jgi:hypothetical protein
VKHSITPIVDGSKQLHLFMSSDDDWTFHDSRFCVSPSLINLKAIRSYKSNPEV